MDIDGFSSFSFSGQGLNPEERAGLKAALTKKRLEDGLRDVLFWGKITAESADYLIAYGLGDSEDYPRKVFFMCTSKGFDLQPFPEMTAEFAEKAAATKGRFKGDPNARLGGEDEDEEPDEEEEEGKAAPVKFSEKHRVAYVVNAIDNDTATVPRGAYVATASRNIVKNTSFNGLTPSDSTALSNFFHFRKPDDAKRVERLESKEMVESVDFLDPLDGDTPKLVWALRVNRASGQATLRSLKWPGYFFYHNMGTSAYGGAYFGDGLVNADIGFMV